jgi:hypothetical protein
MCVHDFLSFLINAPFSHLPFVHIHIHLSFVFNKKKFQLTKVLCIASLVAPPFQKVCENFHIVDVIISPT